MSLQKKIILSFLISSALIVALAVSGYFGFVEIRKEIRYLELSDTLRSKTLQLRRHEKNFLLYHEKKEFENVYDYIGQIKTVIADNRNTRIADKLQSLSSKTEEYAGTFTRIGELDLRVRYELGRVKESSGRGSLYIPIVEATFLERPLANAQLLENALGLKADTAVISMLKELHENISTLRKEGEEILILSKDLDSSARNKVEQVIANTQKISVILLPLFLIVGLSALVVVSRSAVNQIRIITGAIEKTGKGDFSSLSMPHEQDEVGRLIDAFNRMEHDLIERDREIERKNDELLQTRKLASIGTLASGVAHELNNPLNNIYLSAQVLSKEIGDQEDCPPMVKETVGDIHSQTLRAKRIVSDLLEFSREKPPTLEDINLMEIINGLVQQMVASGELGKVRYLGRAPSVVALRADRHLMEQVFVNLFTNAVQAMQSGGELIFEVQEQPQATVCKVSDTGPGIPADSIPRIFDPFFTTKGHGTGLGLAIVYNIIEKHKGKITVESHAGKGTTFVLTIPKGK